jgi:Zn finger protein HypA/HybF involved in hydrogenase expression
MAAKCSCGESVDIQTWKQESMSSYESGKKEVNCPTCGQLVSVQFWCKKCDTLYGGRNVLKSDGGKHYCPECSGLIRNGPILDRTN